MKPVSPFEFPPEQEAAFRRARRLVWWSIAYVASAALALYLTMGSSQAMRTTFLDNVISLVPPLAFLIGSAVARRQPAEGFPYGFHAAVSIGYLAASLALLAMGGFLLTEAVLAFISGDRPTIGGWTLFGVTVWAGWPMLLAVLYAGLPAVFVGRAKLKLAPEIHDKVLFADAEMNKANWMGEAAAGAGVIGMGFGLWWADAAAAALVSLDILRDGARNVRAAVTDLIDETPKKTVEPSELETLPEELRRHIEAQPWVEKAEVRMREEGHVFFGEAFIVPRDNRNLVERIEDLSAQAKAFNWRIHDLVVMPVTRSAPCGKAAEEKDA